MRAHFARPAIQSYSRRPTRLESLYLNLFETHALECYCCSMLSDGILPSSCRQGQALVFLIFLCFYKDSKGEIWSTDTEQGRPIRVELQGYGGATATLLNHRYRWHIRTHARGNIVRWCASPSACMYSITMEDIYIYIYKSREFSLCECKNIDH